jgi:predicted amidohydrolase
VTSASTGLDAGRVPPRTVPWRGELWQGYPVRSMLEDRILRLFLVFAIPPCALAQTGPVKLNVAAVQFRSSFDVQENRRRIVETLERLAKQGVNVAAFPECALTGYREDAMTARAEEVMAAEKEIRATCRSHKIAAVVGSIYRINGHTYDTAVVFDSRGELRERYGKVMLAGEKWATPGNHVAFFELEGVPSTVIICHDERYPELVRLPALCGARVVYYISCESGMAEELKLAPYRAQMMARAAENTVYVIAANAPANSKDNSGSHGQSRIIRDDGNILKEASIFGDEVLVEGLEIKLKPDRLFTPPPEGVMAGWWQQGMAWMLANRTRKLD